MIFNTFQSGNSIELFNPNSREILNHWKFYGSNHKTYDNCLRCSMHVLDSGGLSRMQLPNKKESLGLMQSYLVFQIYLFTPKQFSIEIAISDTQNMKRRLIFSSNLKEITSSHFSCLIPIVDFPLGVWVNLSIDVLSFVSECFKFLTFKSIDSISLSANCKVRKIFTMRTKLIIDNELNITNLKEETKNGDNNTIDNQQREKIPINMDLPKNANAKCINLNMERVTGQLGQEIQSSHSPKKDDGLLPNNNSILKNNNGTRLSRYNSGGLNRPIPYNNRKKSPFKMENNYNKSPYKSKSPFSFQLDLSILNNQDKDKDKDKNKDKDKDKDKDNDKKDNDKEKDKEHLRIARNNNFLLVKGEKVNSKQKKIHNKPKRRLKNKNHLLIDSSNNHSINHIAKKPKDNNSNDEIIQKIKLNKVNVLENKSDNRYKEHDDIKSEEYYNHQSSLDKKKIAQLNTFLYNSKNDYRRENTIESSHIEEICLFDSQIHQIKPKEDNDDILQIGDLIVPTENIVDYNDIKQKTQDIALQIRNEKKEKRKLLDQILDDNSLKNFNKLSNDRPFSPPLNNYINDDDDDDDLFKENTFKMADSINFGDKK